MKLVLAPEGAQAPTPFASLAAIDPDWNPGTLGCTVDGQRHYAYLAQLLAEDARLTAVVPGVTRHGEDLGQRLSTQTPELGPAGRGAAAPAR
ncbi:hypothetical protein ACFYYS_17850 [Streptomyces sp. NPDC002120]|uniref:hypothetical protein n=1 Tax=Streptomyces sp. NPDC002120 TaxID=3364631 RepID=UPI0036A8D5AD